MKKVREIDENAVSPVVGVMLMLVVTIIIAAIVSGFSSGLISGNNQKAPTLTMDIKIANTGIWKGSGFSATVTGVSEAIPTDKLKIITSWHATNRTDGTPITGGNVSVGQIRAYGAGESNVNLGPPHGFGPGVEGKPGLVKYSPEQMFGNYALVQGTGLSAVPSGVDKNDPDAIDGVAGKSATAGYGINEPYTYTTHTEYSFDKDGNIKKQWQAPDNNDGATYVLGGGWENLKPGDVVTVNVVYIPSGKTILSREVTVVG